MAKHAASTIRKTDGTGAEVRLWLGCFAMGSGGDLQTFQMIARATDPTAAGETFARRIRELRKKTTTFRHVNEVYFEALFELSPDAFETPALVNYRTRFGSDGDMWCAIPDQAGAKVKGYAFATDGITKPFVTFRKPGRQRATPTSEPPTIAPGRPLIKLVHRTVQ
jgi:hypothetical protein